MTNPRHVTVEEERRRLEAAIDSMTFGLFLLDDDNRIQWCPETTAVSAGLTVDAMRGRSILEFVHPEDHCATTDFLARLRAQPAQPQTVVLRVGHPALPETYFEFRIGGVFRPDDETVPGVLAWAVLVSGTDDDRSVVDIAELSPFAVLTVAWPSEVIGRSRHLRDILGPVALDDDAFAWVDHLHEESRATVSELIRSARRGDRLPPVHARCDVGDDTRWLRIEVAPISAAGGSLGTIVTFLDITSDMATRKELEQSVRELWHQANHDTLTGLPNRMLFLDRAEQVLRRMRRAGTHPAVLVCDLDDFKVVNDRHGHTVGDEVLAEVARRLRTISRESDTVSRFGGDEFCVLVDDTRGHGEIESLGERIVAALEEPMDVRGLTLRLGITVGAALLGEADEEDVGMGLERADRALLAAKREGKGRVRVALGET